MGTSFAHFLEFDMAEVDVEATACAQSLCELFGEINGAVLATGAAERDHQTLEAARLVIGDAGVHERINGREELVNAFLLVEIFHDRSVLAGELLEFFFATGIGEAAAIENETAAVAAF